MKFLFLLSVACAPLVACGQASIEDLKNSECENCDEIAAKLGYTDPSVNPFLTSATDATVSEKQCVVELVRMKGKNGRSLGKRKVDGVLRYRLKEMPITPAGFFTGPKKFTTNTDGCGVCSDLHSLAIYMEKPALSQDVAVCAQLGLQKIIEAAILSGDYASVIQGVQDPAVIQALIAQKILADMQAGQRPTIPEAAYSAVDDCIANTIGLEGLCRAVWKFNSIESALKCGGICQLAVALNWPANQPRNTIPLNVIQGYAGPIDFCSPYVCPNTINGQPACYPEASGTTDSDPLRLNDCLQCDECFNGGIFQQYAGRSRRSSGLQSGIARPASEVPEITHDYQWSPKQRRKKQSP